MVVELFCVHVTVNGAQERKEWTGVECSSFLAMHTTGFLSVVIENEVRELEVWSRQSKDFKRVLGMQGWSLPAIQTCLSKKTGNGEGRRALCVGVTGRPHQVGLNQVCASPPGVGPQQERVSDRKEVKRVSHRSMWYIYIYIYINACI